MPVMRRRKSNRLTKYNYSKAGSYFITICVKDRHEILALVVEDICLGTPLLELTETGLMVEQYIVKVDEIYEMLRVDKYVIMPNHIHMIVSIIDETFECVSPTKSTLAKAINALKSLTSRQFGESMWQRSYHDHIIRNEAEYLRIWEYIDHNPFNWAADCYYGD